MISSRASTPSTSSTSFDVRGTREACGRVLGRILDDDGHRTGPSGRRSRRFTLPLASHLGELESRETGGRDPFCAVGRTSLGLQAPSEKVGLGWVWRVQIPPQKVFGVIGPVLAPPGPRGPCWGTTSAAPGIGWSGAIDRETHREV